MNRMTGRLAAWGFVALASACGASKDPPAQPPATATPAANEAPAAPVTAPVVMEKPQVGFGGEPIPADDSDVLGPGPGAPTVEPDANRSGLYKQPGPGAAANGLDRDAIRKVIRANISQVRTCYERELKARPALAGTTNVSFTIAPDGAVTSATGGGFDPEVDACVAGAVKALKFPAGQAETNVNYPFTFKSAGD